MGYGVILISSFLLEEFYKAGETQPETPLMYARESPICPRAILTLLL